MSFSSLAVNTESPDAVAAQIFASDEARNMIVTLDAEKLQWPIEQLQMWVRTFRTQFQAVSMASKQKLATPLVVVFGKEFSLDERTVLVDVGASVIDRSRSSNASLQTSDDLVAELSTIEQLPSLEPLMVNPHADPRSYNRMPTGMKKGDFQGLLDAQQEE